MKKLLGFLLFFSSCAAYSISTYLVSDIKFLGLQRVSLGTALLSMPIHVGDRITSKDQAEIIRCLFNTNNFEDIQLMYENSCLIVKVKERPTIVEINFSGNKLIAKKELEKQLSNIGVKVGEAFAALILSSIEKELEQCYRSFGYFNAHVKAEVIHLPNNRVKIKLLFIEGVLAKIQQINIVGNHDFSIQKLKSNFTLGDATSKCSIFSSRKYNKDLLSSDIETLNRFYLDRGYIDFNINSIQVSLTPDKSSNYITINISEGKPYKLIGINLSGNLSRYRAQLEKFIENTPKTVYRESDISKLLGEIRQYLGQYGYAYPVINTDRETDKIANTVKINLNIDLGYRYSVRHINFVGNDCTKDEVLRRELRQMEGAWLNKNDLALGVSRLNRLGYFKTVDVHLIHCPEEVDQVDVIYSIKERNLSSIHAGLSYGSSNKLGCQLSYNQDNMLGLGLDTQFEINKSITSKTATINVVNPCFMQNNVKLTVSSSINFFRSDSKKSKLADYTNKNYSISGALSFPINEYNSFSTCLGYKFISLHEDKRHIGYEDYLKSIGYTNITDDKSFPIKDIRLSIGWNFDNLDKKYFPNSGIKYAAGGLWTQLGSRNAFYKLSFDASYYLPLEIEKKWLFSTRVDLGYANGIGKKKFPFYENFHSIRLVRGFEPNTIGPQAVYRDNDGDYKRSNKGLGGNVMAKVSCSLIFPTPFLDEKYQNITRMSFFADAGNVWDTHWQNKKDIPDYGNAKAIRVSTGLALQWFSPVGPLMFSYAIPIKKYCYDETENFQFDIGIEF